MQEPHTNGQDSGDQSANRLINCHSPYLLQHAHQPVDWYPWGEEAFQLAAVEDKPVFLSIGYATCHWCHVMARQSFADPETARLLNSVFIPIKVDREERPDIDHVYMQVCQLLNGSGGWPLTVLLTPEKLPFFAATYLPRESVGERPGLRDLINQVGILWNNERSRVQRSVKEIASALQHRDPDLTRKNDLCDVPSRACQLFQTRFDLEYGGFGGPPKFPAAHNLVFLLRHYRRTGNLEARNMACSTLRAVRRGGIFDQLGFGIHRYATDRTWKLPHFEKMLPDQALFAMAALEAFQAGGRQVFAYSAQEVFQFVLSELQSPEGAFWSALDADSGGEEGSYYLWNLDQLQTQLDSRELELAVRIFGVEEQGNYRDEATGNANGHNVLIMTEYPEEGEWPLWNSVRDKLSRYRSLRPRPGTDDKILTDWNALMIRSLALGARVLERKDLLHEARRAMEFLLGNMKDHDGRLFHRYYSGNAAIPAFADDYAFLVSALLELYRASLETRYLHQAIQFNEMLIHSFWDDAEGGILLAAHDGEQLPFSPRQWEDLAYPSANSVVIENLIWISDLIGDGEMLARAQTMLNHLAGRSAEHPAAYGHFLAALERFLDRRVQVVVSGDRNAADMLSLLRVFHKGYRPHDSLLYLPSLGPDRELIVSLAPFCREMNTTKERATAWVCCDGTCSLPLTEADELYETLEQCSRPAQPIDDA